MKRSSVKYIHSDYLIALSNKNPAVLNRASMVHELIKSYGILNHMEVLVPKVCELSHLRTFHSKDYIDFLKKSSRADSDSESEGSDEFGLGFDCPTWSGILNYATCIGGATMTACNELCRGSTDIVINWNGGWHHAHREKAGGYCYINDVVLGILVLRKKFKRILYVDLDVHHGDGVQEAFETTKHVFTLSFHQYESGFFPGTGDENDCGFASGKGYSANFPFKSGITGSRYIKYFKRITGLIVNTYKPQVCVIQCGGDIIAGDPLGGSNLYPQDMIECIEFVMQFELPMVLLGGGGYNFTNTCRYWTQLTAFVCRKVLAQDIPDSNEFFLKYGPDYTIEVEKRRILDLNSDLRLDATSTSIEEVEKSEVFLFGLFTDEQKQVAQVHLMRTHEVIKRLNATPESTDESLVFYESPQVSTNKYSKLEQHIKYLLSSNRYTSTSERSIKQKLSLLSQRSMEPMDTNVIAYWRRSHRHDQELWELANVSLAVPATQVSVERAFSALSTILTKLRSKLSKKTLSNILLYKLNYDLVQSSNINLLENVDM